MAHLLLKHLCLSLKSVLSDILKESYVNNYLQKHAQRVHYVLGHEIMYTVTGAYFHRCRYNLLSLKLSK